MIHKAMAILILLTPLIIRGQTIIRGKVIDASTEEALVGANIIISGSTTGTFSDGNGNFSLEVSEMETAMLRISYVGYQPKFIGPGIDGSTPLEVRLISNFVLEEVSVSGVRAGQDEPVSQTTISKELIEKYYFGQDPVFALEKLTPSILAHSESGSGFANYGLMRLRGIDQSRINITLNGIPLNDMIDQGVFFSNFTDFGNSVETIQVQRGVGTSSNGTASYAGSINFESERLSDSSPGGEIELLGGAFGTYKAMVKAKTGLMDNKLAFYSRFSKIISDGYKNHSGTNSNSFFFSGGYFGERDMVKLTSFIGRTQNELAYLPVWINDIDIDPETNYVSTNDTDDFGQQFVQLQHSHWFPGKGNLTSSLYYGGAGGDFPYGFVDVNGIFTQINYPLENRHYGIMSTFELEGEDYSIRSGIHAYRFERENRESVLPDDENPYYRDKSLKKEASIFLKGDKLLNKIGIYGDIQLRVVSLDLEPDLAFLSASGVNPGSVSIPQRSWVFLNPKIGITYSFSPAMSLYASFGINGREPTRSDILGSTNINLFNLSEVSDKNSVKEEYVNDFETGLKYSTSEIAFKANFFYMIFKDEIAPIGEFIPAGFVQLRENIANSHKTGIEWEVFWKPVEVVNAAFSGTYMNTKIEEFLPGGTAVPVENAESILSPKFMLRGSVNYRVKNIEFELSGNYVDKSFLELTNQPNLKLPSFYLINARAAVTFLKQHQFILQINNLFNEKYYTNGAPVDVDYDGIIDGPGYMIQPPRHFFASLHFRF